MKRFINDNKINYSEKFKYLNNLNMQDNTSFKLPIIINSEFLLKSYNINTIEDLNIWINKNINDINLYIIIHVFDAWMLNNINIIEINKIIINNIILILFSNEWPLESETLLKHKKDIILKYINKYIDYYINLPNINDIKFYMECVNYIIKKINE